MTVSLRILCCALFAASLLAGSTPCAAQTASGALEWNARAVEHLLNRAGFGARSTEIRRWVKAGPEATFKHLFATRPGFDPFYVEPLLYDRMRLAHVDPKTRRREVEILRIKNRRQQRSYLGWCVERMVGGVEPLRERMTLFWHGFFTSSTSEVKASSAMIAQSQLLREHALGSYRELLAGILRDPAMLIYLDNISNQRDHPNENLARELLELFSLGEGNYSETDVLEVARSLTGYSTQHREGFRFKPRAHDFGRKTVLGVEGPHDADDIVEILLDQPACARWVAGRILEYLEGVRPSAERLENYAALLREQDYEITPFLRHLFLDPEFYRDEIVGARVLSPIDYLVGTCRRLGVEPHPGFVLTGASLLGQELFEPPNVKGWEEGAAWITTASFMSRGNLAGMLLGVVGQEDLSQDPVITMGEVNSPNVAQAVDGVLSEALGESEMAPPMEPAMEPAMELSMEPAAEEVPRDRRGRNDVLTKLLGLMEKTGYQPRIHLTSRMQRRGTRTDRQIVDALLDDLLAIEAPRETRELLIEHLRSEREQLGIEGGDLLNHLHAAERLLRRLAHLILSLPEAQLG